MARKKGRGLGLLVAFGIGVGAGYLFFGQAAAPAARIAPRAVANSNNNSVMPWSTRAGYEGYSQATWMPGFASVPPIGNPRGMAGLSERMYPNINKMRMIPVEGRDYNVFDPTNVIYVD